MTAWPLVVAALVDLLPTLPGWDDVEVYDGPPVTEDAPTAWVTVGFVDDEDAGSYNEELSPLGNVFTIESGEVRCSLNVVSGEVSLATVRASAFALVDELRESMREDPTLGVLPAGSTTGLEVRVASAQNSQGSGQRLDLNVTYSVPIA